MCGMLGHKDLPSKDLTGSYTKTMVTFPMWGANGMGVGGPWENGQGLMGQEPLQEGGSLDVEVGEIGGPYGGAGWIGGSTGEGVELVGQ